MKTKKLMKVVATTLSIIAENVFGLLLCPSLIEMALVMMGAQVLMLLYALIGTSEKARRLLGRIFRGKGGRDE